jgi:PAS domain S-box-containing protein
MQERVRQAAGPAIPALAWAFVALLAALSCRAVEAPPAAAGAADGGDAAPSHHRVLVLHSYYSEFTWTRDITAGIRERFQESRRFPDTELFIEHMDAKRHPEEDYLRQLVEIYRLKYPAPDAFDLIICSDDQALNFLLDEGKDLFPGVPVVFCGVNGYQPEMRERGRRLTGVIETIDPARTLAVAASLHPAARRVLVIDDDTRTGRAIEASAREAFAPFADRLAFEYVHDLSMEELRARTASLPGDALVFLFVFNRDRLGRNFTHERSLELIAESCPVPIYGPWTFYLGHGIVGGMLTSGRTQGWTAADLAVRVLAGEDASALPVVMESPNQLLFDWEQMRRFGLKPEQLPAGSTIIGRIPSLYERYRRWIWLVIAVVGLQSLTIMALLVNRGLRLRAEAERQRLAAILEATSDYVATSTPDGHLTYINRSGRRMVGLGDDEPLDGLMVVDLHPEWAHRLIVQEGIPAARREGTWSGETAILTRDGREIPVTQVIMAHRSSRRGGDYLSTIVRDLSAQKRVEAELSEARSLLMAALESTPAGVLIADAPDVRIRVANSAALGIRGEHQEALTGIPVELHPDAWQVFHPDGRPFAPEELPLSRAVLRGEIVENAEAVIRRRDGSESLVLATAAPIRNERGEVLAGIVVFADISDRKKAEEALLAQERRFRNIVEASPMGIHMYRLERDGRLVFAGANPAADRILGVDHSQFVGKTIEEAFPPLADTEVPGRYRLAARDDAAWQTHHIDYEDERIKGAYEVYAFQTWPGAMAALFLDVTERERAQAQLESAFAELRDRNVELERFLYMVSHDLKTPLITIRGYLGLLDKDLAGRMDDKARRDMEVIDGAADRMQRLLREVLELSRVGRVVSPSEMVPLGELAAEALANAAGPIRERGVRVELPSDLPDVYGDRPRLVELLQNLIENAVKYMGGQADPRVDIGVRRDPQGTVCFVRDNGMGVEPRYHERVFRPFEQLDPTLEGTGLGLALARRIVEIHGGRIWVESEGENRGSTFCFTLPPPPGDDPPMNADAGSALDPARKD